MVRIRNPWGNEAEWNGAWSDGSPEWRYIPDEEKAHLGITFDQDGEFWMSYKDFMKYFDQLEICNLTPDSLDDDFDSRPKWEVSTFEGKEPIRYFKNSVSFLSSLLIVSLYVYILCVQCDFKMLSLSYLASLVYKCVFIPVPGAWIPGQTAGGCRNFIASFASNPQYRIVVTDPDEEDDEDLCTVIISCMQKGRRAMRDEGLDTLTVGE